MVGTSNNDLNIISDCFRVFPIKTIENTTKNWDINVVIAAPAGPYLGIKAIFKRILTTAPIEVLKKEILV